MMAADSNLLAPQRTAAMLTKKQSRFIIKLVETSLR